MALSFLLAAFPPSHQAVYISLPCLFPKQSIYPCHREVMPIIRSAKRPVYHQPPPGVSSDTSPIPMDLSISQKHSSNFVIFVTFAPGILFVVYEAIEERMDAKH